MSAISGISKLSNTAGVKSVAIYTFSNFLNKGVSFLMLFYFAHKLTENDFGMLSLFSNSILLMMPFFSMGILQSANAEYFKLSKNDFRDFFSTTILMPVIITMVAVLLLFIFRSQLQTRYPFPTVFIMLLPLITLCNFLGEHLISMIRNSNDPLKYLTINIGRLLIEISLAVFFISVLNYGWEGRVTGIFISYLFLAAYSFAYFKKQHFLFGKLKWKYVVAEFGYCVPIIVMQVSVFFMGSSSGYFVEHFTHNFASVGVFSIASTFGSVIIVFSMALIQYFHPKVYSLLSKQQVDYKAIRRHFIFYSGAMLMGTALVIIVTPLAYNLILKPSFHEGLSYYFYICIGYFFWSISYFLYGFMLYHKQKVKLLIASVISLCVSIPSHYFFTEKFGAYGAAISMAVVYFIMLLVSIILVFKQLAILHKSNVS